MSERRNLHEYQQQLSECFVQYFAVADNPKLSHLMKQNRYAKWVLVNIVRSLMVVVDHVEAFHVMVGDHAKMIVHMPLVHAMDTAQFEEAVDILKYSHSMALVRTVDPLVAVDDLNSWSGYANLCTMFAHCQLAITLAVPDTKNSDDRLDLLALPLGHCGICSGGLDWLGLVAHS